MAGGSGCVPPGPAMRWKQYSSSFVFMAVVAGGSAGGRVPSSPATGRSLFTFTLRWISRLSSTLAILFLWLLWLTAAARWWPCPSWSGDWLFSLHIHFALDLPSM